MAHFTYEVTLDQGALSQGDVLERTPELENILKEVHPHYFLSDSYRHFIVLTQTCDLVLRHGSGEKQCKSRYITIAAVRPLKLVVERELQRVMQERDYDAKLGITDDRAQSSLRNFVERLLNNNEDDYFYLEAEPSSGLREDSCAFLRLSIALKSDLHYQKLLKAKILQLKVEFQHKLGYQVGKSYSRVATEDWVPGALTAGEFQKKVSKAIKQIPSIPILDKDLYSRIISKAKEQASFENPAELLSQFQQEITKERESKRNEFFAELKSILSELGVEPRIVSQAHLAFQSNPLVKDVVRKWLR